ncbi:MAG: bifunctional 4-hydroxy-2-oxoglutarate aldolase/2-dehydro-3-deoxy-phosphogluconate aldolase, partial [Akkermansiaceae bacterium]|nr:bifunctional 4-hydroxy-2-oxoglutarate aldolase/2-dehydro-3-deoxy-phosphogluconate aldolase [Akkermansiaceae bacterium]
MEGIDPVFEELREAGVAAVVTIEDEGQAVPLARALLAGGVRAMELTLRTPVAIEAIRNIARDVPGMLLGAGTVLTRKQVELVRESGAQFAVAPGFNPTVVRAAQTAGLPFAPGVATPSDIEAALEIGCHVLKFFPAGDLGGCRGLENMAAPYRHLGLRFIPLGGVTRDNLGEYLASLDVLA